MRTIRNCSVCVTGGAGFLGSHMVSHLIEDRGCKVLVLDNLCVGKLEFVHEAAEFLHCDITHSESFICDALKKFNVKYVFSYAAWPYIPDSFSRPLHVFEVNATGAIKMINAAQEAGADGILQVSSAEIYGESGTVKHARMQGNILDPDSCKHVGYSDPEPVKLSERSAVLPHSTYGAAKAAVDYYCQSAWKERQTPVIALRQFNCVGERETHPYVVPEIVSQLSRESWRLTAWGTHSQTPIVKLGNNSFRDFLYAGDAVKIAVELLERGQFGEVYNLGSETGIKMYDLAKLVGKLMGFADVQIVEDESRKRPWEIWHLQSDNTKLVRCLEESGQSPSFKLPLTTLEEALKRTIAWFDQNGRKWPWE